MSRRSRLLESIAATIADYREGEIPVLTPAHVDTWIQQFDTAVQEPMLAELDHIFKQTYFAKIKVKGCLSHLVKHPKFAGNDPGAFWKNVAFLNIQGGGSSQREMLEMFNEILLKECGLEVQDCGDEPETFLYLDDGIFSGNRVRNDLIGWIESEAPSTATIRVVVIALHRAALDYAPLRIKKAARAANKQVEMSWWRCVEVEDRRTYINTSKVLRPASLPEDNLTTAYVKMLQDFGYPPILRQAGIAPSPALTRSFRSCKSSDTENTRGCARCTNTH